MDGVTVVELRKQYVASFSGPHRVGAHAPSCFDVR